MRITISCTASPAEAKVSREISEAFGRDGATIFKGRNEIRKITLADGRTVAAKKFGRQNIFQRIGHIGRKSKAEKSYLNAEALIKNGFLTPRPISFIEDGPTECYYICEYQPETPIEEMPADERHLAALARLFAALHRAGILHNDLNPTNIRFRDTDEGTQFSIIDLNRMYVRAHQPSRSECIANTFRFTFDRDIYARFAPLYLKEMQWLAPGAAEKAIADKLRFENRLNRKRRLTHPIKNFFKRLTSA